MKKYLLVDTSNCFMRAINSAPNTDTWTKVGLALHITLNGIKKMWDKFEPNHVVFCAEGRSWRKDFDEAYKRNRSDKIKTLTAQEKEELDEVFKCINAFCEFVKTKTNATLLQDPICEADDMIAGWIWNHPDDECVIISTDTDYQQLLSDKVKQYNPVQEILYSPTEVLDSKGKPAKSSKGVLIEAPIPEYALFYKCIRGDTSDNVFSAYPGVREKSTKNKIGILDAFADIEKKGYNWNTFMNSRWMHHDGTERVVREQYEHNKVLVDLTMQPQHVKEKINATIKEAKQKAQVPMVGIHFARFCAEYDLQNVQKFPETFVKFLSSRDV